MPKHAKYSAKKSSSKRTVGTRKKVKSVELVETEVVQPRVDAIETTTEVETVPTVEIRKPATLSQALTERATIVEKPQTRVVGRTVKKKRVA